tara:strand:- start:80 stop:511 length:432 start_codon:yes stop_codon:yes gene_type:complete
MIQGSQINAQAQTEKKKYPPLPEGTYSVELDKAEVTATKNNDGFYLACSFKVTEGDHTKRLIWENFMLSSSNPGSQRGVNVGTDRLNKMLKSIGVYGGFESLGNDGSEVEQFKGRGLILDVGIDPQEGTKYDPRNKINKFIRK